MIAISKNVMLIVNVVINNRLNLDICTCQLKYENNAIYPRFKKFFTNENISEVYVSGHTQLIFIKLYV